MAGNSTYIKNNIDSKFLKKIDRFYTRIMEIFDRIAVPIANKVLNQYIRKHLDKTYQDLETAIGKGIKYFERQEEMIFDAIATFTLIINKSFDDRLVALDDKIVSYTNKMRDPHLRLLDSKYDPGSVISNHANAVDLSALSDVEKPLVRCLYADRLGLDQRVLQELGGIDDNGGYGTTHFLIGCVILKKFSSIPGPMLDGKIEACLAKMVDAQKYESASDLFSERTVLMQWLGHSHLIQPAWIGRILRAQLQDGGWRWSRSIKPQKANQHSSALGLAALIYYREHLKRQRGEVSQATSVEIGGALPIISGRAKT
jgi:hypothetical protein